MKRFLSTLLVAMLIVACLSTAAFAAGQAKVEAGTVNAVPGKTATVTFTVSGEFANYELFVKNDAALELVSITCDGEANTIAGSDKFGKVTFAKGENLTKNTFTATFKVPATAKCGDSFKVTAEVIFVSDRNLQKQVVTVVPGAVKIAHVWELTGTTAADCKTIGEKHYTCSICGATKTEYGVIGDHNWGEWTEVTKGDCKTPGIEERVCSVCGEKETRNTSLGEHNWGEWTKVAEGDCKTHATEERVCSVCGEKETRDGELGAHDWSTEWSWDAKNHWHACKICGEKQDHAKHNFPEEGVKSEDGKMEYRKCTVCGYIEESPVTGDRIMIISGIAAMSAVLVAAAFVCKRKFTF